MSKDTQIESVNDIILVRARLSLSIYNGDTSNIIDGWEANSQQGIVTYILSKLQEQDKCIPLQDAVTHVLHEVSDLMESLSSKIDTVVRLTTDSIRESSSVNVRLRHRSPKF